MANVTFTIPDNKIQFFIDEFGWDYEQQLSRGLDPNITKPKYAKQQAFKYLADRVKAGYKERQLKQIEEVDITS